IYSNKVFKVVDDREEKGMYERGEDAKDILPKIEYESELQHKLREIFGIDIVFHFKDDKQPFGYTLIDNSTDTVYKGSDILKMKDVFQFTEDTIEKKTFERLKYYNLRTENEKQIMLDFFKRKGVDAKDFMLFENKSFKGKNKEFQTVKGDVKEYVKNPKSDTPISIVKNEDGDFYAIHERYHQVHKLEYLIGRTAYERFTNPEMNANNVSQMREHQHVGEANILEDLGRELEKNTSVGRDTTEDDLKKRRKKRK
ncbi:MAG: mobilization protein, partial [Capnocytophaga sp.]|nr:mobilization protein [Capnocytophaga sp.]